MPRKTTTVSFLKMYRNKTRKSLGPGFLRRFTQTDADFRTAITLALPVESMAFNRKGEGGIKGCPLCDLATWRLGANPSENLRHSASICGEMGTRARCGTLPPPIRQHAVDDRIISMKGASLSAIMRKPRSVGCTPSTYAPAVPNGINAVPSTKCRLASPALRIFE